MNDQATRVDVVVLGGGYAGTMAANRLTGDPSVRVTLVNSRPRFVERVRLHQYIGGSDDGVEEYRTLLSPRVRLVVDTATRILPEERIVRLRDGGDLRYDYLVYAVGSVGTAGRVPGATEFARVLSTLEDAQRLRSVLAETSPQEPIVIVGGGPLGIETAAELAEAGRSVTLVCGSRLGPYLHPKARARAARGLRELGVTVVEGTAATRVLADRVELDDGRVLSSTVTIWTVGFIAPDLARVSGLTTDELDRLVTDETLTSVDDVRIVATGDAASPSRLPMRMSCQAALPLGSHAADTVLSRISGRRPREWDRAIAAMCLSLGRKDAVVQLSHFDDTAGRFFISGGIGARVKEAACRSPFAQISTEARKPGTHSWPVRDRSRRAKVVALSTRLPAEASAPRQSA